jgi:hypothetical protein
MQQEDLGPTMADWNRAPGFRHFWREVPDSLHIHAYPCISALNLHDFSNHESPANDA